jgi:DNA-binding NarL/FixJ family response regulator
MPNPKVQPMILVVTRSKHVAAAVDRRLKHCGLTTTMVTPPLEAIPAEGESPCVAIVDALHNKAEALDVAKRLTTVCPPAKAVLLAANADLTLVSRAAIAGASHVLLDNTPTDEFATAISDLIVGKPVGDQTMFWRVYGALPFPTGGDGTFRTPAGRRLPASEAIKQCDQFGLSTEEIAEHLRLPVGDVERVTKAARKVVKASVIGELLGSLIPVGGSASVGSPSLKPLLAALLLLVIISMGMRLGRREPPRHLISGDVTFAGQPVKVGIIRFTPKDAGDSARPIASGEIRDGKYAVKSGHGSSGGSYKVAVSGFTGVARQTGPILDPLGDPLFPEVTRDANIPCSHFQFNVKCD